MEKYHFAILMDNTKLLQICTPHYLYIRAQLLASSRPKMRKCLLLVVNMAMSLYGHIPQIMNKHGQSENTCVITKTKYHVST